MKSQNGQRYSNLNSNTKSARSTSAHTTRNFRYRKVLKNSEKQIQHKSQECFVLYRQLNLFVSNTMVLIFTLHSQYVADHHLVNTPKIFRFIVRMWGVKCKMHVWGLLVLFDRLNACMHCTCSKRLILKNTTGCINRTRAQIFRRLVKIFWKGSICFEYLSMTTVSNYSIFRCGGNITVTHIML